MSRGSLQQVRIVEFATNTTDLFQGSFGESSDMGVNDVIFCMTTIFLLPVFCSSSHSRRHLLYWQPHIICTLSRPFPKWFGRLFCLRNTTSGFKNCKQIPDVVCFPFSHLISSLINQRLVALSLSLTINTSVDNSWSDFLSGHLLCLLFMCVCVLFYNWGHPLYEFCCSIAQKFSWGICDKLWFLCTVCTLWGTVSNLWWP